MADNSVDEGVHLSSVQCTICEEHFGYTEIFDLHTRLVHSGGNAYLASEATRNNEDIDTTLAISNHGSHDQRAFPFCVNVCKVLAKMCCELCDGTPPMEEPRQYDQSYCLLRDIDMFKRMCLPAATHLARSHGHRHELLQIANTLGLGEEPRVLEAFHADERSRVLRVKQLVREKSGQRSAQALRGEDAQSFLDLVQDILLPASDQAGSHPTFSTSKPKGKFRKRLRRVITRLAQDSDKTPSSMTIEVNKRDQHPLGGGSFADVYKGELNGQHVALKVIRVFSVQTSIEREKVRRALRKEALLWFHLEHPNVLPTYGIDQVSFPGNLCLVSPWLLRGNIAEFLQEDRARLDHEMIIKLLQEVLSGLSYLHAEDIVHGDIRLPNILIDDEGHARLADFGLANFADSTIGSVSATECGAVCPELCFPEEFGIQNYIPTKASDIFAFGTVCLEVYHEKSLFHNAGTSRSILLQLKDDTLLPFTEKEIPEGILRAVAGCWTWAPSERPDVDGINLEAEQCAQDRAPMVTIGITFRGSRIFITFFFNSRLNPSTATACNSVLSQHTSSRLMVK